MKRWLFIIGIVIILSLISVWLFLLFASNETKQDIYNRFGFTGTEEGGIVDTIVDAVLPDLETERVSLRQLTTKRVVGYAEVALASSSPQVYFAEAGTGHIYSLNLQNGVEAKISNITVAGARLAAISKNATFAAIKTGDEAVGPLTIILFTNGSTESFTINESVLDFTITDGDQLLYTIPDTNGVIGRSYDISTKTARTIFNVPFREVTVEWGTHSDGAHYIHPKPSRVLEGYLYEAGEDSFKRIPVSGYGLTVLRAGNFTLFTKTQDANLGLFLFNSESNISFQVTSFFFPEKCTVSSTQMVYCAHDKAVESDGLFPDNWYRGEKSYSDDLWSLNLQTLEPIFLVDTSDVSGRDIDIIDVSLSNDEFSLYFKNKNDHTLWVYDVVSTVN